MKIWLKTACDPINVRCALKYALIVGPVLVAINDGDVLLRHALTDTDAFKIALTILVPYLVSTFSSVGAVCRLRPHPEPPADHHRL